MLTAPGVTAFIGVGFSPIDRTSDRSIVDYAQMAAIDALRDAGIERDDIDGYVGISKSTNTNAVHVDGADEVSAYLMTESLGLEKMEWISDVSGFAVDMAVAASHAILSGRCTYVLGVRAMYNLGQKAPKVPTGLAWGTEQYKLPFGAGPGGTRFATRLRRYMEQSGAERADLYEIVRASREHARENPVAYFNNTNLSLEEYLDARLICDPLCLYDCDLPVCGAGAFVITDVAHANSGNHPPAYLRGHANWSTGDTILARSDRTIDDVQVCQLYDGYSFMMYEWLERLGWCDPYRAWKFVASGATRPGGPLPVNTFGGSIGEGRLHGMGHLREGILQVMHRGGARQVPNVKNCLVQVGPFDRSSLAMLSVDPW